MRERPSGRSGSVAQTEPADIHGLGRGAGGPEKRDLARIGSEEHVSKVEDGGWSPRPVGSDHSRISPWASDRSSPPTACEPPESFAESVTSRRLMPDVLREPHERRQRAPGQENATTEIRGGRTRFRWTPLKPPGRSNVREISASGAGRTRRGVGPRTRPGVAHDGPIDDFEDNGMPKTRGLGAKREEGEERAAHAREKDDSSCNIATPILEPEGVELAQGP